MRKIKSIEANLLKKLTNGLFTIPEYVRELNDGNMGSISFDLENTQKRKEQISNAIYTDEDGVLVDIELSKDENGNLYELDFWKVDFSPLKRYPTIDQLDLVNTNN